MTSRQSEAVPQKKRYDSVTYTIPTFLLGYGLEWHLLKKTDVGY